MACTTISSGLRTSVQVHLLMGMACSPDDGGETRGDSSRRNVTDQACPGRVVRRVRLAAAAQGAFRAGWPTQTGRKAYEDGYAGRQWPERSGCRNRGLLAMSRFQKASSRAGRSGRRGDQRRTSPPPNVKAAEKLSMRVAGEPLPPGSRAAAGMAVHYGFGAVLGAADGLASRANPQIRTCGA